MATERKREQVALLEERLGRASITIGIDYRGLSVRDMMELRRAIRAEAPETELRVIKNTLWRRASEGAGEPAAADLAQEATALLFGFGDLTEAPKALQKYTSEQRLELSIHGVYVEGQLQDGSQVAELADVPSRPELMAKVAGGLSGPAAGLAGALSALFRDVAAIVEARAVQLDAEASVVEASEEPEAAESDEDDEPTEAAEASAAEEEPESDEAAESDDEDAESSEDTEAEAGAEADDEPEASVESEADAVAEDETENSE